MIYWWLSPHSTFFNEHERLAQAMVQGHLWINDVPSSIEHFQFKGHTYLVQPPGPALLLIPLIVLHAPTNQVLLCVILGALAIAICSILIDDWPWLTILCSCGTITAYYASLGDAWAVPLVGCLPFSLLAVRELITTNKRPIVIGLFAGIASLFRYDLVLTWPIYAFFCWRKLWQYALALTPSALFLLWFNWARFGNPFTTDLSVYAQANHITGTGPTFGLQYLPVNLGALLFMPPNLTIVWPYLHPHFGGQALIWTTPAFLAVLRVRELSPRVYSLWLIVICALIPSLTVWAYGYVQFGFRYAIQIYPFLIGLLALHAEEEGFDQLDKILTVISIFFVQFGWWHIRQYSWNW